MERITIEQHRKLVSYNAEFNFLKERYPKAFSSYTIESYTHSRTHGQYSFNAIVQNLDYSGLDN